jgi:hypothetical protein
MRRRIVCLVILLIAVAALAVGFRHARKRVRIASTNAGQGSVELERQAAVLDLRHLNFKQALDQIRSSLNSPIISDGSLPPEPGGPFVSSELDPQTVWDAPIDLRLHDVALRTTLDVLLAQMQFYNDLPLRYELPSDGSIRLFPTPGHGEMVAQSYDVRKLLHDLEEDRQSAATTAQGKQLLEWLPTAGVDPDSWDTPGKGAAWYGAGRLVVVQTRLNQRAISTLLQRLSQPSVPTSDDLIADKLDQHIGEFSVHNQPVGAVVQMLADRAGVNILVNWLTMDPKGTSAGDGISEELRDPTLHDAICLTFRNTRLGNDILISGRDNVLNIMPAAGADPVWRAVKVFDARPFISMCRSYAKCHFPLDPAPDSASQIESDLGRAILESTNNEAWKDNGGHAGSLLSTSGRFVVIATPDMLRQTGELFDAINARPGTRVFDPDGAVTLADSRAAFAGLNNVVPRLKLEGVPLESALATLDHIAPGSIAVDWHSLQSLGVWPHTPVTLNLRDVSLHFALSQLLKTISPAGQLDYGIRDGVILVCSSQDGASLMMTRVYDMRALIDDVAARRMEDFAADAPGEATRTRGRVDHSAEVTRQWATWEVINALEQFLATDSWKDNGGFSGSVVDLGGRFVITQTPENHLKIATFLRALRAPRAGDGTEVFAP